MRRGGVWRFEVALVAGVVVGAFALAADPPADSDAKPQSSIHYADWLKPWFEPTPSPKPAPRPAAKPDKDVAPPPKPAAPAREPSAVDKRLSLQQREEKEWLRREQICDQLRRIAQETHDESLEHQADSLSQRAWALYMQRTGAARFVSDDKSIDQHLPAAGAARLTNAAQGNGNDRATTASIREDRP